MLTGKEVGTKPCRRHDISDKVWALLERIFRVAGAYGAALRKTTVCSSTPFSDFSHGRAPWRDLPPDLGGWRTRTAVFIRWRDAGIWEKLLNILIDDPMTNG